MEPDSISQNSGHNGEIAIAISTPDWQDALPALKALVHTAAHAAANHLQDRRNGELSVAFVSDTQIQTLNKTYRGKDKPTNVLSFPADNINPSLGDIVIAFETCAREAKEKTISLSDHTTHLLVHGYLHLNGYDHIEDMDAQRMEALEIKILRSLDIASPYEKPPHV